MSLADFPDAETMLNDMLRACEDPRSVARVKFGDSVMPCWQTIPGPELLKHLEGEVRDLTIDSVTLPADAA